MFRKILTVAVAIFSTNAALSQEKGDIYEGSIKIKDRKNVKAIYEIPLPTGKWMVENIEAKISSDAANAEMKEVKLIEIEKDVLGEAIEITAKTDAKVVNWIDEPCKMEPVLYKNSYGTKLWKQKCLTILPSTFLQNNNEPTRTLLKELANRGIRHDFNSIMATYTRYGDYNQLLIIRRHFFPSNYGLGNPVIGSLNTSPYHPSLIGQDQKKKDMIEALSKYMEDVVISYDAAYERKSFRGIKNFEWPRSANNDASRFAPEN